MIPGLTPAQAGVLEVLLVEQGLTTTLHAVAELARAAAGHLEADGVATASQRRWAAYGERIDELAYGLAEPDGRWETPLWHPARCGAASDREGGTR